MFFRGLRFWLLCIISLLTPTLPTPTPPKKNPKHSRGNRSKIQNVASSQWQTTLCCAKELLQEHPDLSSTSFYSQLACVLPAPLAQTPHLSQRVLRKVWGGGWSRASLSDAVCVFGCALGVASQQHRRSGAPTERRSRAWNHLSSALKGPTWIFNDEPVSFLCQVYSTTPFYWMHI